MEPLVDPDAMVVVDEEVARTEQLIAAYELTVLQAFRDVEDALIQIAIYCGIPAGVEAFKTANKVLQEMRDSGELVAD